MARDMSAGDTQLNWSEIRCVSPELVCHRNSHRNSRNSFECEICEMREDKLYLLLFWAGAMGLWSMSVWGGWAEKTYENHPEDGFRWYWLRVFGIPRTRQNCVRFLKGASFFGMALLTIMTGAFLLWGK